MIFTPQKILISNYQPEDFGCYTSKDRTFWMFLYFQDTRCIIFSFNTFFV